MTYKKQPRNNQLNTLTGNETNILITGGAGYIGSHMVAYLLEQGITPVVLDNLSSGHRDSLPDDVPFFEGNYADHVLLAKIFQAYSIDCVIHFGGSIQVGESVVNPHKYYHNNVVNTVSLLDFLVKADIKKFIFSSTAAVYGDPQTDIIAEDHPKNPINPYGASKLMVEQILQDYCKAYDLRSVSLRYFNASGAHPSGQLAERHEPETHLIPLLIETALGRRDSFSIYGDQYPTQDGTCIRDFIHVMDLAAAHFAALEYLNNGGETMAFNVGVGHGYSVKEVVDIFKNVVSSDFDVNMQGIRVGDPASLVACTEKITKLLGWKPVCSDIETIMGHAWAAQRNMLVNVIS